MHEGVGKDISVGCLSTIFLELQARGAHNVNLVTPTPYIPHIVQAIQMARQEGLRIPICTPRAAASAPIRCAS
ncbi:MAG: hypothetical protein RMK79_08255 [Anaerolineae bacterium]|nr:hypothetical protein [Anaerolineae bacterium]